MGYIHQGRKLDIIKTPLLLSLWVWTHQNWLSGLRLNWLKLDRVSLQCCFDRLILDYSNELCCQNQTTSNQSELVIGNRLKAQGYSRHVFGSFQTCFWGHSRHQADKKAKMYAKKSLNWNNDIIINMKYEENEYLDFFVILSVMMVHSEISPNWLK